MPCAYVFFRSSNTRLISLQEAKLSGCRNILALRGYPPAGKDDWEAVDGGFEHGVDLVRYIRKEYGDYFDVAVAGYPQTQTLPPEERAQQMAYLKEKVDAGANFIFTQMFYDAEMFIDWVHAVRAAGITVPVVPGITPIQTWNGFLRAATAIAKTIIPSHTLTLSSHIKIMTRRCARLVPNSLRICVGKSWQPPLGSRVSTFIL